MTARGWISATPGVPGFRSSTLGPAPFPYLLELVERHPDGAQAFIAMHANPFLVIVAPDVDGQPGVPRAFVTNDTVAIFGNPGPLSAQMRFARRRTRCETPAAPQTAHP